MPKTSSSDHRLANNRRRIEEWIKEIGFNPREMSGEAVGLAWAVAAEDGNGLGVGISQQKGAADKYIIQVSVGLSPTEAAKYAELPRSDQEELSWDMRLNLVQMGLDFTGLDVPFESVNIFKLLFSDGLTKDAFAERVLAVRRGMLMVSWSIGRKLGPGAAHPLTEIE